MSRRLPVHRVRPTLSEALESRLSLYSVAAVGAGVSMLALAEPAFGKIVITNTNLPITLCRTISPCPVAIDLNKDGINDFNLQLSSTPDHYNFLATLNVTALKAGGGVMAKAFYASCLLRGAKIGPSAHFSSAALMERSFGFAFSHSYTRNLYGNWGGNHPNRFLGVKFHISGKTHYGWVRVTVNSSFAPISATITEYGYETIANKTVSAGLTGTTNLKRARLNMPRPEASSLGTLALGAEGSAPWRREEESLVSN